MFSFCSCRRQTALVKLSQEIVEYFVGGKDSAIHSSLKDVSISQVFFAMRGVIADAVVGITVRREDERHYLEEKQLVTLDLRAH